MSDRLTLKKNEKDTDGEYLTFDINGVIFGISTKYIESVSNISEIKQVSNGNGSIEGTTIIRGHIIKVVNLGKFLFNQRIDMNSHKNSVVCKSSNRTMAFVISNIHSIIKCDSNKIISVGTLVQDRSHMISGVITDEKEDLVQLLDVEQMINDIELE